MSKAFTKEQDGDQDEDSGANIDEGLSALPNRKNYMTPKGHERLKS
jgi:hypothetical protein